jgi:hypothetical protein
MKKCLQPSKCYPPIPGGIETTERDIAEWLTWHDWQVEVLSAYSSFKMVRETGPIPIIRVGSVAEFASASVTPRLFSELRRSLHRSGIVHVHLPNPFPDSIYDDAIDAGALAG